MTLLPTPERHCGVILVTYNSSDHLPRCLASLRAQQGVTPELWIVDNASADGSLEVAARCAPVSHRIANETNLGFARGVNRALAELPGRLDFVALVNPDTIASPDALAACIDVLEHEPDVAVVAPRLVYPDGSLHPSCHGFLDLWNLLGESLGLDYVFPGSRLGTLHLRAFAHDRRRDVDWIQGAFLVVRAAAIRAVGPLDPSYFMYGEEMDWCRRMRRAGFRTVFLPEPSVVHVGGASTRGMAGSMFVELQKSRLRFLAQGRGPAAVALGKALIACGIALRGAVWSLATALSPWRPAPFRERVALRRRMFGAAWRWVLAGQPIEGRAA